MHSDQEERLFGALKRIEDIGRDVATKLDALAAEVAELKKLAAHPPMMFDPLLRTSQTHGQMPPPNDPHYLSGLGGTQPIPDTGFSFVSPSSIDELEKTLNSEDYQQGKVAVNIEQDGTVTRTPIEPEPQATQDEVKEGP